MAQLNNQYVSSSFQGLLKMTDSTQGLTNTLQTIQTGDGDNSPLQMSLTQVNISGSFLVNGQPVSIETGSFATTGSNTFIGDQTITGSLYVSSSVQKDVIVDGQIWVSSSLTTAIGTTTQPQVNVAGYRSATRRGTSQLSPGRITLFESSSVVGQGQVTISPSAGITIFNQNSVESQMYGQGVGSDNTMTYNEYKGVYNLDGTVDVEQQLEITSSGSLFQDWDNSGFVYSPYMSMAPNNGNSPIPQMLRGLGVTGSIDITGQYLVNGIPVSGDRNGLITTGSITDTQQITGSLILGNTILSGSLIGNTVNGGLIKIQSEANRSGSVQFNITGSSPISQSNVIFGNPTGPALNSGSIIISGSNNILLNGTRFNNIPQGQYGYIGGNTNIISTIPSLNTASLVFPTMTNNLLYGNTNLNFVTSSITSSLPSQPIFNNNQTQGGVTINHQSGSINMVQNIVMGNGFSSTANRTPLDERTVISNNLVAGLNTVTLNHNSSSINYTSNIGNITVTNNYTSSVAGANNITVAGNLFNGQNNNLVVTGSNSGTRRQFNNNIVNGNGNIINSNHSGSSFTGGHLIATTILGQELIVSASHTSTTVGGSTFVGRYNATGSLQESSQETVFVVGTGTNAANRRNALRIDNNNNSNFTGSVNISGSLLLNGVAVGDGNRNGLITTGSLSQNTQNITGSVIITGSLYVTNKINDLKIWTGSAFVNSIGIGTNTLQSQSGSDCSNVAIGNGALSTNVTGSNVVAIGGGALGNSVAGFNLAIGGAALSANTTGENNIGIGQSAFQANTIGGKNTAIGWNSGVNNLTGSTNTIIGAQALSNNVNGSGNIAIGHYAGYYSTGSNGFYIGNDNYGGLNTEQEKSMMYGEFNNTTNNQSLRINAKTNITNNLVVTGSIDITGTYYVNGVAFSGGTSGTSGSSGSSGSDGTSGSNGSSGSSGSDGTSGSNGSSGTSGDSLFTNQGAYWNTNNNIQITGSLIVTNQINNLFLSGSNANIAISQDQDNVLKNSTDGKNIGIGNYALKDIITGEGNIAIGDRALEQLNGQNNNLAIGNSALRFSQGQFNTAIGATALINNTSGSGNFGFGYNTLGGNTTGNNNLGIGTQALVNNVDGSTNVGVGNNVLTQNVSGSGNIVLGNNAGYNETSSNNFYIGNQNYNSIDNDRSGSLMWGKLDSTTANQTLQINAATNVKNNLVVTGSLRVSGDVMFASGSNTTMGTVALDGGNPGTATVSNSLVTTSSLIFLTKQTLTNAHMVAVSSKGSGTFTITSNGNGDSDVVAYQIINPV